jgi:hypothetical protein
MISFVGWVLTLALGSILLVLGVTDLLFHKNDPYNSLVTYVVLPGFLMGGVSLIILGIAIEWRRRHRKDPSSYPKLPAIDLNLGWQRRRLIFGLVLISILFGASSVGVYQSYHFTESPVFCGLICHQVMKPEYTAYQYSPHARVACVQCHIGPGADWYVKSKMSGLYQVYSVLTHAYHLPIQTPVRNLRPAQQTCEQCHWPEKFMNSMEKVIWHFSPDRVNTPVRYNLLLKVGGGSTKLGMGRGIHWHISPEVKVRYWAADTQRMTIPWVEIQEGNQPPRVYRTPDCPDPLPADAEIRTMDCIDCHNRPSHVYRSPHQLIDFHMASGMLDRSLPFLKRYAAALFEQPYPDTPAALSAISTQLEKEYAPWMQRPQGQALVKRNIKWLQTLYQRNFFPEQKVDWRVYPNHIGHFEFPGCFRCHDGQHAGPDGGVISSDCQNCHEFLDQAEGEAAFGPIQYQGGEFRHPRNLGDIWKGRNCTDCHGVKPTAGELPVQGVSKLPAQDVPPS